jgi:hypothetical protein
MMIKIAPEIPSVILAHGDILYVCVKAQVILEHVCPYTSPDEMKETRQAMYIQRNTWARSRNVYTPPPPAHPTAWYQIIRRARFNDDLM